MIVENALDGQPAGTKRKPISDAHRARNAEAMKTRWADPEYKEDLRIKQQEAWTQKRHEQHQSWLSSHWTNERKKQQSNAIRGSHPVMPKGVKKTASHRIAIAAAIAGVPKVRCCRVHDRREMSVGEFTKWVNQSLC